MYFWKILDFRCFWVPDFVELSVGDRTGGHSGNNIGILKTVKYSTRNSRSCGHRKSVDFQQRSPTSTWRQFTLISKSRKSFAQPLIKQNSFSGTLYWNSFGQKGIANCVEIALRCLSYSPIQSWEVVYDDDHAFHILRRGNYKKDECKDKKSKWEEWIII